MNELHSNFKLACTPKELLDSPKISLEAKGLYGYLQSRPQGWEFSLDGLAKQLKVDRKTLEKALEELKDSGYLVEKGDDVFIL